MLRIYQFAHSPYCIPITQALTAFGVSHETVNVSNADRGEIIRLTKGAYYQVPVLDLDGKLIYDGSEGRKDGLDVAYYVDQTWGGARLFPKQWQGVQDVLIQLVENDIEGISFRLADIHYVRQVSDLVERTMIIRHKERRFGRGCLEEWSKSREALFAQVTAMLQPFEEMLVTRSFLLDSTPVYLDFALFGVIGNFTYNDWNPLPPLPKLKEWHARMKEFRF